jgi:ABC-2 type transport system permease protein
MTFILVRKLLRDIRTPLIVVALLLCAFQFLWAHVTRRITDEIFPYFRMFLTEEQMREGLFKGTGQIVQTLMGGERIAFGRALDMFSIAYVHPLTQTILCIWAVGRASSAIAGEIDRGTMELLLAQPLTRSRVVLAHLVVDVLTIPVLCLSMWAGSWMGAGLVGMINDPHPQTRVDPLVFAPALMYVAALVFAVSGYTMWVSSLGRFRGRVLGLAVLSTLLQFLVNVIGQLWAPVEKLRPLTVFYYYQPQQLILESQWHSAPQVWTRLLVLLGVGSIGYLLALWTFCRRDLPAPL